MEIIKLFLEILESPHIEKPYKDLRDYYLMNNQLIETEALNHLLKQKFHADDQSTDL